MFSLSLHGLVIAGRSAPGPPDYFSVRPEKYPKEGGFSPPSDRCRKRALNGNASRLPAPCVCLQYEGNPYCGFVWRAFNPIRPLVRVETSTAQDEDRWEGVLEK